MLWMHPADNALSRRRRWLVALPIAGISLCVVLLYMKTKSTENLRLQAEFERETIDISHRMQMHFNGYLESLYAVESLFIGSQSVEKDEFRAVVRKLLERNPGMQGISWNKYLRNSERRSFVADMRDKGQEDFEIMELGPGGIKVPVAQRANYAVVTFIEPAMRNEPAIGLNVLAEPTRRDAIIKARDEGRPVATSQIALIQDSTRQPGILVFLPIYQRDRSIESLQERRENITGYVVGIFLIREMASAAMHDVTEDRIDICLSDAVASDAIPCPFDEFTGECSQKSATTAVISVPDSFGACLFDRITGTLAPGVPSRVVILDFAGRPWSLTFRQSQEYIAMHRSLTAWSVLCGGFLFTGFFGAFMLVITGRSTELEASEARYRGLFDETPSAIVEKDFSSLRPHLHRLQKEVKGNFPAYMKSHPEEVARCAALVRVIDANRAAIKLYDAKDRAELLGPLDRILENPASDFLEELLALSRSVETFEIDKDLRTLSGERKRIHMRWSIAPATLSDLDRVIVSSMDITARELAARALKSTSEQLAAVSRITTAFLEDGDWAASSRRILASSLSQTGSESGLLGVVSDDSSLRIIARENTERPWRPGEENSPDSDPRVSDSHALDIAQFESHFSLVLKTGKVLTSKSPDGISSDRGADAGQKSCQSFMAVPITRRGAVVGLIGVANRPEGYSDIEAEKIELLANTAGLLYDLSRQREREAGLEQQMRRTQRLESIGLLAAGVAHEINNPLTYILQNIQFILEENNSSRTGPVAVAIDRLEMRAQAREAFEGAKRVQEIVRGLKTFARDADGVSGAIDVRRAIENALKIAHNEIRFRARLIKKFHDVPPVIAEEGRLVQVFLNFLVNAAQAIPEGHASKNEISISLCMRNREVLVEIRDTGRGMSQEVKERIFDPFFTTKPVGEGTGLGLSICHNTVTAFGGRIDVESEVGRGTRFVIHLPAAEKAADLVPAASSGAVAAQSSRRGRILVVDDESQIRTVITRILGRDHQVVSAVDGMAAIELLESDDRFDAILCDLMMPRATGMELHADLEEHHPALAERMIFMTGGAFTADARSFLERIRLTCLEKPFTAEAVRAAIDKVLNDRA